MRWSRRKKLMFVTGGTGVVGRHLAGAAAAQDWEMVALPSAALDIRSRHAVIDAIREWKPTAVVHLAYRRDDRRVIVAGSTHVAEAAAAVGARLVHMSTDVVFGGRPTPYTELDLPSPITDYGAWKAEAETAVAALHPSALLLRTSLVFGSDHLAPWQRDIELAAQGRSSMTFFSDEIRCPIHGDDLAAAIAMLAERTDVIGPLHVAGPEAMSRIDIAREVATWMGYGIDSLRESAVAESGQTRPACVILDSTRAAALGVQVRPLAVALRS